MTKILIVGSRGSGKTTLANELGKENGWISIDSGNPISTDRDNCILQNYITTQKEYIQYTICQHQNIKNTNVFLARGPENLYYYTIGYPIFNNRKWSIDKLMHNDLQELKKYFADLIIMLDLKKEEILNRCQSDSKVRTNMDMWINFWFNGEKQFFETFNNLIKVDTTGMEIPDMVDHVKTILKDRGILE